MQAEMRTKMQAENADHHHHKFPKRQTHLQKCPNAGLDTHNLCLQVLTMKMMRTNLHLGVKASNTSSHTRNMAFAFARMAQGLV